MEMIRLMQSTFFHEEEVKQQLCDFIMQSERLSMGEQVAQYEHDFAAWQESPHAVAVNSGSSANLALIQALLNLGLLSKGDEVGFSSLTWSTNPMPLFQLGLAPVGIDVELDTLCVSLQTLSDTYARHPSLKCLFITNLLGFCADLEAIAAFCRDHNILLIEDNCESLGSVHQGKKLGNYGIASTFSTFVGHHLSTIEGGVVCTGDDDLMDAVLLARAHGWNRNLSEQKQNALRNEHDIESFSDPYTFYDLGFNLRPTEINGVIGQHQLPFLDDIVSLRAANFARYAEAAQHNTALRQLSMDHMDVISNFAFPVITHSAAEREPLIQTFIDARVEIRPLVSGNILRQPFFKRYSNQSPDETPNSNQLHDCGFYIPNHPELSESDLTRLTDLLGG